MCFMALVFELIDLHMGIHVNKKQKKCLVACTYLYCRVAVVILVLKQACYSEGNAKSAFGGQCSWCCLLSFGWVVGSLPNIVFLKSIRKYN